VGVGGVGLALAGVLIAGIPAEEDALQRVSPAPSAGSTEPSPAVSPLSADQVAERRISDPAIDELSGLAASRLHAGVLYGINDSGGSPVVHAIDAGGDTVARLRLEGVTARDWEALAPGWDAAGRPVIWIGDIGDNQDNQERVRLLRIAEPAELVDQAVDFQTYWLTYPDGSRNAEALMVHPKTGEISVATKGSGEPGAIYRPTAPLRETGDNELARAIDVPSSITDGAWELSPAGEPRLILIDYWRIYRFAEAGWVSEFGPLQLQREALAWPWLPDAAPNDTVLLGSEGTNSTILTARVP
jgi:hypothetical protein